MDELREAFNAAYDEAESEAVEEIEAVEETPAEDVAIKEGEDAQSSEKELPEAEEKEVPEDPQAESDGSTEPAEQKEVEKANSKVPQSWSATAKETWVNVPESAQKEILKREGEVNTVLQQSAIARRAAETFNRTIEPFKSGLIASGVQDPFQAVGALLKTEATLRAGTQRDKSQMIAKLINDYGVDIGTLDSMLVGETPAPENDRFEQMLNAKLAPVNDFLAQQAQFANQQNHEIQNSAQQSIQQFSQSAEFMADVRMDMADLLDMAASRNQEMSLEEAYNKACALNPEISKIMETRKNEKRIMGSQASTQRKKAAAASLTGRQGGAGSKSTSGSLHDQISAAWDEQTG